MMQQKNNWYRYVKKLDLLYLFDWWLTEKLGNLRVMDFVSIEMRRQQLVHVEISKGMR